MNGGKRPGAGRPPGRKNKATIEREAGFQEIIAQAKAQGVAPLAYMLKVMRDESADEKRRDAMAIAAAAYVHPKLQAIEHSGSMTISQDDAVELLEQKLQQAHERRRERLN